MEVSYYRLMALIARNYAIAAGRSETMKMVVVIARWVASRCLGGRHDGLPIPGQQFANVLHWVTCDAPEDVTQV